MKTIFTFLFSILIASNVINAQQQIQNPGFEEWEDVGFATPEPVNWSSIKTSDNLVLNGFAPVVWGQSTDAHSGSYSLYLFNVYNALINSVASGTITNGRIHSNLDTDSAYAFTDADNEQWHTVLTDKPDSIVGWFKCNPVDNDFGTVKFLLHTGYAQLPGDETNHIAIAYYELPSEHITQWTRFSTPFVYTSNANPEYFLSILTSGNGLQAVDGSTALFDDLEFIYNGSSSVDEVPEGNFNVVVTNNKLVFEIDENSHQEYDLKLTDINGRLVIQSIVRSGESNTVSINDLQPGLYIAVASNSQKSFTKKVLIK